MTSVAADSSLGVPDRRRLSVERINRHADAHGVATDRVAIGAIDRSMRYTCDSLCPLAHAAEWSTLTAAQQLRYNQLVGLMQNEWICFFEQQFAVRVLPAIARRGGAMPAELVASLEHFVEDERKHTEMFRALNRAAEPAFYARGDFHVLRIPAAFRRSLRLLTARPDWFPMTLWIMLLMEERSLMNGRRFAQSAHAIEPTFAHAYRAHVEDEVRHVQLDWHLLERFYQSRPAWLRRANAKGLEWFVVGLFLKPRRANVRLIDLLIADFPELRERRAELIASVRRLGDSEAYRTMMYGDEATPIGRGLIDRLPEFAGLRRALFGGGAT